MIIPVRCFSCGKVVGNKWEKFVKLTQTENVNDKKEEVDNKTKMTIKEALDFLGLRRGCCRSVIMGHIEFIDKIIQY